MAHNGERKRSSYCRSYTNEGNVTFAIKFSAPFGQTILPLGKAFDSTTYFREKNILYALIEGKSKVKEIFRD